MEANQSMDEQFLSKVHHTIEENIDNENFSVESLAKEVGLSRSMLHRKLIKISGKSASDTITHIRISKARELLEQNSTTVSETAYQVGFRNPSYFNRVFKRHYNMSPGDMKKMAMDNHIYSSTGLPYYSTDKKTTTRKKKRFTFISLIAICAIIVLYIVANPFASKTSVAVLPLENLTGNSNNDYIVSGINDALIGELGKIKSLRVISRKSTQRYKESNMLLKDIAKELNVKNIIEGSILSAGDSIHLIIKTIRAIPRERQLMSKNYHDHLSNVLNIQNKVAKDIAHIVKARISKKEMQQLLREQQVNPEVYKAYLRGMFTIHQGNQEWFNKGIGHMHEAIKIDPGEPFAYAGLALGYATMGHGQFESESSFLSAEAAAKKAIKLDPTIAESYTALYMLYLYKDWNWPLAKESFETALTVNPNNADAHAHFAWYHYLFQNTKQSLYHAKQATLIDPIYPDYHAWLAALYFNNKQYKKAEHHAYKALAINENTNYAHATLGWLYIESKQFIQAIEVVERFPKTSEWDVHRIYCYTQCNENKKALEIWNYYEEKVQKQDYHAFYIGMMAACLGYNDKAFMYFNEAIDNKTYPIAYINVYPFSRNIRNDSRYAQLFERMNLPKPEN
ncbi:helix-turn-helix domain-containing protein [Carboxylicivirga marina]|uniref:Helix-turn-helix domain-containing protein n=1 Tax=Carboxylicivirga marina TaxID=2800988 RepID=A0ABS1HDS4_9BACT|nr:helix-turn-helix domain-containing protein [Carboxylicivirga marina]MBK3515772.1 helix-turn-helix domain-containing protein [Carboxylicivirga marina]